MLQVRTRRAPARTAGGGEELGTGRKVSVEADLPAAGSPIPKRAVPLSAKVRFVFRTPPESIPPVASPAYGPARTCATLRGLVGETVADIAIKQSDGGTVIR